MGIGGISVGSLLLVLVIVLLVFGTKKLRNVGSDLGGAIKGFRSAMKEGEEGKGESKEGSEEDPSRLNRDETTAQSTQAEQQERSQDRSS